MSGTKGDAESLGRVLLALPSDGDEARAFESASTAADPRLWIALERARDSLCWDDPGRSLHSPAASDGVLALCVKALFADGRVREQAVRLLAASTSLAALPVLTLRAADWVPAVREAARAAVGGRLEQDTDGAVLAAVCPMALLLSGRREGLRLAAEVTRRLPAALAGPAAGRLLESPHLHVRRAAFGVLADSGELDLERATRAAMTDRDTLVRSRCAEYAGRQAAASGSLATARLLLTSRTPLVRVEALAALNRLGEIDEIRGALPDPSGLVRGTARFYLKARGVDVAGVYRQLVATLLSHPRAKVRAEAIRASAALAPAVDVEQMFTVVCEDPSAAVVKQATSLLLTRGSGIDPERLLALVEPGRPPRLRAAAHRLLSARDSGWRLAVDIALLADAEPAMAERALNDLTAALRGQLYTRPSGRAAELIAAHLSDADRILPARKATLLRVVLGLPQPASAAALAAAEGDAAGRPPAPGTATRAGRRAFLRRPRRS